MSGYSPLAARRNSYQRLERDRCVCCYSESTLATRFYLVNYKPSGSDSLRNSGAIALNQDQLTELGEHARRQGIVDFVAEGGLPLLVERTKQRAVDMVPMGHTNSNPGSLRNSAVQARDSTGANGQHSSKRASKLKSSMEASGGSAGDHQHHGHGRHHHGGGGHEEGAGPGGDALTPRRRRASSAGNSLNSPRSFEELPARSRSDTLELPLGQLSGAGVAAGGDADLAAAVSPRIASNPKALSRLTRKATKLLLSATSTKPKKGAFVWDGKDRVCAKHFKQNEDLIMDLITGASEGRCLCCYTERTKSPAFHRVVNGFVCARPVGTDDGHEDGAASTVRLLLAAPNLLLPGAPDTVCQKHFQLNAALYETAWPAPLPAGHQRVLDSAVCLIPHPNKKKPEDAFFIAAGQTSVGLADGVGGWASMGVDPSAYSTRLCREMRMNIDERGILLGDPRQSVAVRAMHEAWCFTQASRIQGSTTCCLAAFDQSAALATANLGDSGFLVIRNGSLVYASEPQQHAPNTPFQLGTDSIDTPQHATPARLLLRDGDLLVMGSDGLFDNLYTDQIVDMVRSQADQPCAVIAGQLSHAALAVGADDDALSPFAAYLRSLGKYPDWIGGKLDDITTIVARVSSMDSEEVRARYRRLVAENRAAERRDRTCPVCGSACKSVRHKDQHVADWHREFCAELTHQRSQQPAIDAAMQNLLGFSLTGGPDSATGVPQQTRRKPRKPLKKKAAPAAAAPGGSPPAAAAAAAAPKKKKAGGRAAGKKTKGKKPADGPPGSTPGGSAGEPAAAAPPNELAGVPQPFVGTDEHPLVTLVSADLRMQVVPVPSWPIGHLDDVSFVEFTKTMSELEKWENLIIRHRQSAAANGQAQTTTDSMLVRAPDGSVARRQIAPDLRSEYIILPFCWTDVFHRLAENAGSKTSHETSGKTASNGAAQPEPEAVAPRAPKSKQKKLKAQSKK